jgi:hypothetical protein
MGQNGGHALHLPLEHDLAELAVAFGALFFGEEPHTQALMEAVLPPTSQ